MGRGIGRSQRRIGIGVATSYAGGGDATCTGAGQSFNGTDQYAFIADNGALDIAEATTDFCISCKLITSTDITSSQFFVGKLTASGNDGRYGFYISSGILRFFVQSSSNNASFADNITLAINTEYHLLGRVDIANGRTYFYIDGVLQSEAGLSLAGSIGHLNNVFEFNIGAGNNTTGSGVSNIFEGAIKDVRIYHKDVTPNLTELMAGEKIGDEVAWWCLPALEGFDDTDFDLTGVNL